jgi:uncharacterized protein YbjT (DUF2867 family)
MKILLTGATGYIGKELLRKLDTSRYEIHCLARNPSRMDGIKTDSITVHEGDLLKFESIKNSFKGVKIAFYLAHSMDSKKNFKGLEISAATNFARAAAESGVEKIIYLGALGSEQEGPLSSHLKSRKQVGNILRNSGIQVIEFQASIIIGSGSLSYEMIRALSERLPLMIMPKWVNVKAQPISIKDALDYLTQAIDLDMSGNKIFEIGGPDRVSYKNLIQEYSRQRSLKRILISVPVLTPWLSSLWLTLVTPVQACVGRKLIQSVKNPTLAKDSSSLRVFNKIKPMNVSQSIALALKTN